MIDLSTLLTILTMALVTYATRVTGYLLLRNRVLSARMRRMLEAIPGCVLIAVIAPAFATQNIANLLALALTLLLASRCSFVVTVVGSIVLTALLRYVFSL
ncbi:AzlD domain-containing protein [Snodgrassella sp. B3882]|uniref:AzlD family protein n=1 Tax=Snodgrassella sp. B3882 TaxID=2818037 RepID=UPI00226A99AF|nr:AzlD domain-containing protein [Snodgrassella sp. B3882]MCX8744095.1 AzlD domain-containing protein [Snodgrassella sp. B3882]